MREIQRFAQSKLLEKRKTYQSKKGCHVIFSLLTIGLWLPVWIFLELRNYVNKKKIDNLMVKISEDW